MKFQINKKNNILIFFAISYNFEFVVFLINNFNNENKKEAKREGRSEIDV